MENINVYMAEFFGTLTLILFGVGINAGTSLDKSYVKNAGWIVTAVGWGLAVTMGIYVAGKISGAHINPAVTIGLWASGDFSSGQVVGYIIAQMLGAIVASTLVWLHYLPHWKKTEDPGTKLGVFSTGPAIDSPYANLFSEILGTTALLFMIMLIGANKFDEGFNPIAVGALVVIIGMSMGGTTGYAINPARDLGPRIAHFLLPIPGKRDSNWSYSWIPVVGPLLGGVQGTLIYNAFFLAQVEVSFYLISAINLIIAILAIRENLK